MSIKEPFIQDIQLRTLAEQKIIQHRNQIIRELFGKTTKIR